MDMKAKQQLRDFLGDALAKHGDHADFADDESLFLSGRLDSFSMMNLVMHLEESFGIDFSEREFDVELLDTVNAIAALVAARAACARHRPPSSYQGKGDFMLPIQSALSRTFDRFFESEKASGIVLILCTLLSLALANSPLGPAYRDLWHTPLAGLSVEHWINDGLMAVFFLFVGLELERELYNGELSNPRNALLPIFAAAGGIVLPALIHFALNGGSPTQGGAGIPMATDIAFALGVLALLGSRIPVSLKVFLTALAVMDDLGAIIVIALFYSTGLSLAWLVAALAVFGLLVILNRVFRVMALAPYLAGGALMWFLMLKSGIHATIAGVLLAFAIPFSARAEDAVSPSHRLEHILLKPAAFFILPVFALANTGIVVGQGWMQDLLSANSLGIVAGLVAGKPLGILLLTFLAVRGGLCSLPGDLGWRHILGAGMLGGIGFTMSIFITNLAFAGEPELVNASKMAILLASLAAGSLGYAWLRTLTPAAPARPASG